MRAATDFLGWQMFYTDLKCFTEETSLALSYSEFDLTTIPGALIVQDHINVICSDLELFTSHTTVRQNAPLDLSGLIDDKDYDILECHSYKDTPTARQELVQEPSSPAKSMQCLEESPLATTLTTQSSPPDQAHQGR